MAGYTYMWEFHVEPTERAQFERDYGPEGTWVALFRQAPGYIETLLLRERSNSLRYITIDRWQSEEAYRAFRAQFSQKYDELDRQCQRFTTREVGLGEFSE